MNRIAPLLGSATHCAGRPQAREQRATASPGAVTRSAMDISCPGHRPHWKKTQYWSHTYAGRLTRDPVETTLGLCSSRRPNKYPQAPLLHSTETTDAANFISSAGGSEPRWRAPGAGAPSRRVQMCTKSTGHQCGLVTERTRSVRCSRGAGVTATLRVPIIMHFRRPKPSQTKLSSRRSDHNRFYSTAPPQFQR